MVGSWNRSQFQHYKIFWVVFMVYLWSPECLSLNLDGVALLEFRSRVEIDPYGAFDNWNPEDDNPCNWSGIRCIDGKVATLNLDGLSLRGMLAPELGKLSHLRTLVLHKNNFSGILPKEIGSLTMLQVLDLRSNNLTGEIPKEIEEMPSLKHLLLCDNSFPNSVPPCLEKLNLLPEIEEEDYPLLSMDADINYLNRKLSHRFGFKDVASPGNRKQYDPMELYLVGDGQHYVSSGRRRLFQEASNLPAVSPDASISQQIIVVLSSGSGSFPAIPYPKKENSTLPSDSSVTVLTTATSVNSSNLLESKSEGLGRKWAYLLMLPGAAFLVTIVAGMLFMLRSHSRTAVGPWRSGLSGQLQKAFISGVPKLQRTELEAACEDFSNIIQTLPDCTVFKGTLSSGVEIAVVSTAISSFNSWSKSSQTHFQKKIDSLSRINHKNFVNLLGYCEENGPFMRMMVFEYAPNGNLFEHLHVKELEYLDWGVRMRIVMGVAYCLQYMHHELNPPLVHPSLRSNFIYLTDDYAAKIADIVFWKDVAKGRLSEEGEIGFSVSPSTRPRDNVHDFGMLLLEIISGKHPWSEEEGSIANWAAETLKDNHRISYVIDPALKSVKNSEVDIVCEVIHDCVNTDPRRRLTMREVTSKLRDVLGISPESATPRLSPLWWAELEILTVEAS